MMKPLAAGRLVLRFLSSAAGRLSSATAALNNGQWEVVVNAKSSQRGKAHELFNARDGAGVEVGELRRRLRDLLQTCDEALLPQEKLF